MKKSPPVITVDLDSTLCDTGHRIDLLRTQLDWREYAMLCADDGLVPGVHATLCLLASSHAIIALTGRPEQARELTEAWLKKNLDFDLLDVLMDNEQVFETHGQYKARRIKELMGQGYDVVLHIDDWKGVADEVAALGVPTLVVRPPWVLDDQLN